jgi:uncharacterized protein YjbI with pentapeptide repeats
MGANLAGANLSGANLTDANLTVANLAWANLEETNLSRATLIGTYLPMAFLSRTNLSNASLIDANLSGAYLSTANLSGTIFWNSFIIAPQEYESIKLNKKTDFKNAICDSMDFLYHVSKFTLPEHIPTIINNRKELMARLEKTMLYDEKQDLESVLKISKLPE